LIIPLIIQTIRLHPSGPDQIDAASNVSREDPSDSVQIDAEHLSRNRKVVGSNPTSGSTSVQVRSLRGGDGPYLGSGLVVFSRVCCGLVDDHAERAWS
jgi:hypothetical protein